MIDDQTIRYDDVADGVTTPPGSYREAFNDAIVAKSVEFARTLLDTIPELEGVAIVPSCTIAQHNVGYGIIMGRHGPLRTPAEVMHMASQLHGCLRVQLDNAWQCLQEIDSYMAQRQTLLQKLEADVATVKRELYDLNSRWDSERDRALSNGS